MPVKTPDYINRPPRRLNGALKPGTVAGSSTTSEVVNVGGASRIAIRIKASGAGSLFANWVGPDGQWNRSTTGQETWSGGTVYTSGNAAAVTVTGGTEALLAIPPITADFPTHSGESWLQVGFTDTSTSTNTISYVDIACLRSGD